jgi:hypothetical protein
MAGIPAPAHGRVLMEATVPDALGFESFLGPVFIKTLPSFVLLLVSVAVGIVALVSLRRTLLAPGSQPGEQGGFQSGFRPELGRQFRSGNQRPKMGESGRGDWENMLASCKNLRDEGVLSEEEFRQVRTLVDPRLRTGVPELRARHWPPTDPAGPEAARK